MIPTIRISDRATRSIAPWIAVFALGAAAAGDAPTDTALAAGAAKACLSSGDGYLRAHVGGAIEAEIDWPNSGTACAGEPKIDPPGVRLSFQRIAGARPNLLFLFGLTGVREGAPLHDAGAN